MSKEKEISRSKYSILDIEEEEDMGGNHDEEEIGDIEMGSQRWYSKNVAAVGGKWKRANVQVQHSSHIQTQTAASLEMVSAAKRDELIKKENKKGRPNQAAAENEHWVITGSSK